METFQYQIVVDPRRSLVRIDCVGILGLDSACCMVAQARACAIARQLPLLYDFRRLQLPLLAPLAVVLTFPLIAGLPRAHEVLRSAAIVAPEQDGHEVWEAYRLASRQSGMHWNYFLCEQAAMHWLQERNHWDIGHTGSSDSG